MKKIGLFLLTLGFVMTSCASEDTVKYTIASAKADCVGVAPMECMQVKKGDAQEWTYFYSNIEGFTYEPGFEYVLDVKEEKLENVPADASSIKYTLVKLVSKTQKESENMLEGIPNPAKFQWTGKVLSVEGTDVGTGAAKGQFAVTVLQIEVTSLGGEAPFKEGDIIHSELVTETKVKPEVGNEYVFKAKNAHPAHALGVYMLDTDVQDLVN